MKRFLLLIALLLTTRSAWADCPAVLTDCRQMPTYQTMTAWGGMLGGPWTTGSRPSPVLGLTGFNTTLGVNETWNGSAWVSGGGGNGTVSAGLANQMAWYSSSGTVVGGLTTANSGVLVTDGSGVPSISTTLPSGLALGTPASLTLTNALGLPIAGLTGLGTGVASALGQASSGTGGIVRATSATLNSPTLITPALGTPTALVLTNATGLPNAGLINSSTTVNGVVCTLGSTCAISATAASITVGTTSIVGGVSGRIEYNNAGLLGELTQTGTGNVVLATSPTIATPTVTGSFTATGLVSNADLTNPSVTVNGTVCTLGSTCNPSGAATAVTVGVTTVGSGVTGRVLFDSGGVLGEYPISGSGSVVLSAGASLSAPSLGTPSAVVLTNATGLPNAGLVNATMTVNGTVCTLGASCTPPGVVSITPTLVAAAVASDTTLGTLPANGFLGPYLLVTETAGTPVTIAIGTTLHGTDVLPTQPTIPANGSLTVDITAFSKGWFSPTAPQTLYLTTSGGGAVVTAQMFYWVIGTTGGGAGGGVTSVGVSTPGSTLTLGGTNPITGAGTISADLNLTHPNTWTGQQTFASPIVTGAFTATGLVTNADLVNASTTVNGTTCTLGSTCTITATSPSITVGTTTISGGTNGRVEFNNAGVLGEIATTGSGSVALATSPTFVTPNLGTPASGVATNLTGTASGLTAGTATNQSGGFVAATTLSASSTVTGNGFIARFSSPGPIGDSAPSTGAFTTLSASSTVSGTGFTARFATPGPIGNTVASTGAFSTVSATGQITSTLATGTAPLVVASTTNVANLNASSLGGATFAAPGAIGGGTPGTAAFTTLSASSTVSGAGFTARFASPGAIGSTSPSTGAFTTLSATSTITAGTTLFANGANITTNAIIGTTLQVGSSSLFNGPITIAGSSTAAVSGSGNYNSTAAVFGVSGTVTYGLNSTAAIVADQYFATSDRRTKSSIVTIDEDEAYDWISRGRPVTFIKHGNPGAGFIAQEDVMAGRGASVTLIPDKTMVKTDDFSPAGYRLVKNYEYEIAYLSAAVKGLMRRMAVLEGTGH